MLPAALKAGTSSNGVIKTKPAAPTPPVRTGSGLNAGPRFIDLFAGCGGLSLGLMKAGWTGVFAVEKNADAFKTLSANFLSDGGYFKFDWPDWFPRLPCDIRLLTKRYEERLIRLRGTINLIAGGPPCQGFSYAGSRDEDDPRNRLFNDYVRVVRLLQPDMVLMENVPGIATEFGKTKRANMGAPDKSVFRLPHSARIAKKLDQLGYFIYADVVRSKDYGIPQTRQRYILFGVRKDLAGSQDHLNPHHMLEQHRASFLRDKGLAQDKPVTAEEAISDLETTRNLVVDCPDTNGFKQISYAGPQSPYQRLMNVGLATAYPNSLRLVRHRADTTERFIEILRTCRRGVNLSKGDRLRLGVRKVCLVPLDPKKPSSTVTTLPDDLLHYSEPRILTVRECARLQSFPDWFEFHGQYTTGGPTRVTSCPRYTQVGNAVPPLLSEVIGRVLLKGWHMLRVTGQAA